MTRRLVCDLTDQDTAERTEQARRLAAGLVGHDHGAREARLRFEPTLAAEVHRFVEDESRCCSFFAFRVDERDEDVELTVGTPAGGEAMLDALVDSFT